MHCKKAYCILTDSKLVTLISGVEPVSDPIVDTKRPVGPCSTHAFVPVVEILSALGLLSLYGVQGMYTGGSQRGGIGRGWPHQQTRRALWSLWQCCTGTHRHP